MNFKSNTFYLLIFGLIILFYQNCADIALINPNANSDGKIAADSINGTICYSSSVEDSTRYQLANLYVINMNALSSTGRMLSDSNQNGVTDELEEAGSDDTVLISNVDTDEDGLPDFVEKLKGLNPTVDDLNHDGIDLDGVTNRQEIQRGTDPSFSDANEEHIRVDVRALSSSDPDCGEGQPSYSFHVKKFPLIYTKDFIDTKNSVVFNLSHTSKQNNILVLAHLNPDDVSKKSIFLAKVIKLSVQSPLPVSLQPRQLVVLSETQDGAIVDGSMQQYQKIATGKHHACGLTVTQKVFCWGANESGQLGDGTVINRPRAVEVVNIPPSKEIALGDQHSCAISVDGDLYCWGANANGQLGIASVEHKTSPQQVGIASAAQQISLGSFHTCVELENKIQCWGSGANGQLGIGSYSSVDSPRDIILPSGLVFPLKSISSRETHTCMVDNSSTSYCWGRIPSVSCSIDNRPQILSSSCAGLSGLSDSGWSSVLTDGHSHVGMKLDGKVSWWNSADFMPTEEGPEDEFGSPTEPLRPAIIRDVIARQVSIGSNTVCFIEDRAETGGAGEFGTVLKCFQPQRPEIPNLNYYRPEEFPQVVQPIALSSSSTFSCALDKDGVAYCWGENGSGQLGIGNYEPKSEPTTIPPGT